MTPKGSKQSHLSDTTSDYAVTMDQLSRKTKCQGFIGQQSLVLLNLFCASGDLQSVIRRYRKGIFQYQNQFESFRRYSKRNNFSKSRKSGYFAVCLVCRRSEMTFAVEKPAGKSKARGTRKFSLNCFSKSASIPLQLAISVFAERQLSKPLSRYTTRAAQPADLFQSM